MRGRAAAIVAPIVVIFVLAIAILGLMGISGVQAYALGSAQRMGDRVPLLTGSEALARVELAESIPIAELPALATAWGVRVEGFQHTYPAPHRPVTIGVVVPSGVDVRTVINDQLTGTADWVEQRLQRMLALVPTLTGAEQMSMNQNVADLRAVQSELLAHGPRVSVVNVRGPAKSVQTISADPRVKSVK